MTKFHWTKETAFIGHTLRDHRGFARGVITGGTGQWFGQVFQPDLPSSEAFPDPTKAAWWVMNYLRQIEGAESHAFADFKP